MDASAGTTLELERGKVGSLPGGAAWIEGAVVPIEEARIPITDTGFSRSDLTYDVVGVWKGAFFRLEEHLDRFERGCGLLRLQLPYSRDELAAILHELVRVTGLREAYVDVICTRGTPPPGSRDPRTFRNRFYAYVIPYVWLLPWDQRDEGMDAVIARTTERISPRAVDPTVKNFHWGDLTKGLYEAYDRGARFPLLLNAEGHVTEGPGYNVFGLVDGRLLTPVGGVLQGITRRTVLDLAEREGIGFDVREVTEAELWQAAELFATSTAGGVMAITSLDGKPVGDGRPGPVTTRLRDLYWAAHEGPEWTTPVDYSE
ncbi:MAG: aminotransferase class IV [Thermoleophilia bacterium]